MGEFSQYLHLGIPRHITYALFFITLGICGNIRLYRKHPKWYYVTLLSVYIIAVLCKTVVFRPQTVPNFDVYPFWSYIAACKGKTYLIAQIILNVALFIPVGFFLVGIDKDIKWKKAILFGACLSFLIETLQHIFEKGVAEFDDVLHNTIGCMIGYLLMRGFHVLKSRN